MIVSSVLKLSSVMYLCIWQGEQLLMRSRYNTTSTDKNAIYAFEGVMHLMYVAGIVGEQDGVSTVYTIRDIVAARVGDDFDEEIIKFDWRFDGA